jgi:hypothetical protein
MEPFSLGVLGALAATEGIKFLYGQAGEVLKRWRDRKAGRTEAADAPLPAPDPDLLEGDLRSPIINYQMVDQLHDEIRGLGGVLAKYASGFDEPNPNDAELSAAFDGLRRALEVVYGQRITFKGESREASGAAVVGRVEVESAAGDIAAVRARLVRSGRIEGTVRANKVEEGGKVTGVEIDQLGT